MSADFRIKVNDIHTFEYNEDALPALDATEIGPGRFHILHQNRAVNAELVHSDFNQKKYQVKINNNTYDVVIANALDQLIVEMGLEKGKTKHINSIKAPMPGLILEIAVQVGQQVSENDNLLILSAMKMENSLLSPREGLIKAISVKVGDAVDKGQLLIEFE